MTDQLMFFLFVGGVVAFIAISSFAITWATDVDSAGSQRHSGKHFGDGLSPAMVRAAEFFFMLFIASGFFYITFTLMFKNMTFTIG